MSEFTDILSEVKGKERKNLLENLAQTVMKIDNHIIELNKRKDAIVAGANDPNLTLKEAMKLTSDKDFY